MYNKESTRLLWFCGRGEGRGHGFSKFSKGTSLARFADPFNSTIYNYSYIAMRAATTKIPHLLYEKGLLKTPNKMCGLIYNWWFICWEWEKNSEIYENAKAKTKEKIPRLVALLSPRLQK